VELAAAQLKYMAIETLRDRLALGLNLSSSGPRDAPARHRTLQSTIGWSHDLLSEGEQVLLRRLSVFVGGCTLETARTVCAPGVGSADVESSLFALVDKSLLGRHEVGGETRFRMLEIIRQYAAAKLEESGESEKLQQRMAASFVELVQRAEPMLFQAGRAVWFLRLDAEYANLVSALKWLREKGPLSDGLRLAAGLGWYWFRRARYLEAEKWLRSFRSAATEADDTALRARLAYYHGLALSWGAGRGPHRPLVECGTESLRLYRLAGDRAGEARSMDLPRFGGQC
jgi:predicted ATPase